ncbi:hypothetical protein BU23DRAFT_568319 [Bimuria novae-zelandiae CBS 107.79]|uniref:C2H2-type domain-containing protein n=1 Tax=Bimuria novae-zelandiae CBS 107.79 TaxID=1447943 RepID=A0A6A5V9G1_9PLEO|nr:hypothetical protein BU23DRAFT_568319 [Bimuria novae-zelandiae CBS 107.79]
MDREPLAYFNIAVRPRIHPRQPLTRQQSALGLYPIGRSFLQIPTPRRSTVGSNHSELQYQQHSSLGGLSSSLYSSAPTDHAMQTPQFSPPNASSFTQAPRRSPPTTAPRVKTQRRTRRSHHSDEPIGLVYEDNKKFKCIKMDCKDLTFGRMADLRRHHSQHHAKNRAEFFCSVTGCPRAHAPTGGKSRSFGTRRDKRDEHERNVHKKERSRESSHTSMEDF